MIVGTHFGLFMPALRPNWATLEPGEPELQVRSRRKIDLLNLKKFMEDAGLVLGEPFRIPNTDYQWRAYCTREAWGFALLQIAQDMDYTKFKDTPQKYHGDTKLTNAYGKIWNATLNSFPTGSSYDHRSNGRRQSPTPWHTQPENRRDETVVRRGGKDWVMAGSNPEQLAALMREIDAATVPVPTDAAIQEMLDIELGHAGPTEVNGHLDHTKCAHSDSANARRKCRKRFYGSH